MRLASSPMAMITVLSRLIAFHNKQLFIYMDDALALAYMLKVFSSITKEYEGHLSNAA